MGRASKKQGPANLLGWRGDNCKEKGRIVEGTRIVFREEFPGTMDGATVQEEDPAARCDGSKAGGMYL